MDSLQSIKTQLINQINALQFDRFVAFKLDNNKNYELKYL